MARDELPAEHDGICRETWVRAIRADFARRFAHNGCAATRLWPVAVPIEAEEALVLDSHFGGTPIEVPSAPRCREPSLELVCT